MLRRKLTSAFLLGAFLLPSASFAQTSGVGAATAETKTAKLNIYTAPKETIDKIREEGMGKNSQVMQTLSYLTDVIGPRLTNSPGMKRANEWTRDQMAKWGLQNAKLVSWGPWGRGWSLKSFTAQVTAPQPFSVIAYPKAWSPSTKGAVTADVVFFDAKTEAELEKYKGKLNGKIVLISSARELKAEDKPLSARRSEDDLLKMAQETSAAPQRPQPQLTDEQRQKQREEQQKQLLFTLKRGQMLLQEGAAVLVDNSTRGSGGTLFVQSASVVQDTPADLANFNFRSFAQPYKKESEAKIIPQMTMATEDYNRLVRMINQGVTPRMTIDIQAQYHDEDMMGYNTIAEIPGTDPALKDEVVMLGAHLDSWHSSTGATDNAAGSAVAMEAARIILASGLKPRRTIRVALWSGEEQGLNGSREYVKQVFGEMKNGPQFGQADPNAPKPELVKGADYDKLSAYYNLDNGTGKIRGVYLQGNSAVKPIFEAWLAPFADLGAKTLTILNTSGTDHLSFDRIGLPGFQFIQDEVEYSTRTHHSNQDNFDRIQADDMKQASTIMAAFVYQTAMMDEKLPRKPVQ
ncbi:MAG TPA: M20/M25/M40 family metallo-hydrolase [Pyrinomonadaceae bacterium]